MDPFGAIWRYLELFGAIWIYLKLFVLPRGEYTSDPQYLTESGPL